MNGLLFQYYKQQDRESEGDFWGTDYCYTGFGFNQKAFTEMAEGYKQAADYLVDKTNEDKGNSLYSDRLVYPAFFCYRQAVELLLKAILMNIKLPFNRAPDDSERKDIKFSHDLQIIFSQINDNLLESDRVEIDLIGKYIAEFNEVDPRSEAMRYPGDKDLHSTLFHKSITAININYTKEHFPNFWELLYALYSKTEKSWAEKKYVH